MNHLAQKGRRRAEKERKRGRRQGSQAQRPDQCRRRDQIVSGSSTLGLVPQQPLTRIPPAEHTIPAALPPSLSTAPTTARTHSPLQPPGHLPYPPTPARQSTFHLEILSILISWHLSAFHFPLRFRLPSPSCCTSYKPSTCNIHPTLRQECCCSHTNFLLRQTVVASQSVALGPLVRGLDFRTGLLFSSPRLPPVFLLHSPPPLLTPTRGIDTDTDFDADADIEIVLSRHLNLPTLPSSSHFFALSYRHYLDGDLHNLLLLLSATEEPPIGVQPQSFRIPRLVHPFYNQTPKCPGNLQRVCWRTLVFPFPAAKHHV